MNTLRPLALVVMGVSGSGKSTIGKLLSSKTDIPFIEGDHYHPEENIQKMTKGVALTDEDRIPWLRQLARVIHDHLEKGSSCILSCSALKADYRRILETDHNAQVKFIYLHGTPEMIVKRMADRQSHFMPLELLTSQFETLEYPVEASRYDTVDTPEHIANTIIHDLSQKTEFGVAGMGVMGSSISRNLASKDFRMALYNREVKGKEEQVAEQLKQAYGELTEAMAFNNLSDFVASLQSPRKILLMVPSGDAVDQLINDLLPLLSKGDVIIDGGNSHYKESSRRLNELRKKGIFFLGCGISGGEKGALEGPSLMPGGSSEGWVISRPFLMVLAARDKNNHPCCSFTGGMGSGHFIKMIHNGIEYAEMQLLAELYHLHKRSGQSAKEISKAFSSYNSGELNSYLLTITCSILSYQDNEGLLLETILDKAGNKGTGSWATISAAELGLPATMIASALFARYLSYFKDKRTAYDREYKFPKPTVNLEPNSIKNAYALARIINHIQGFEILQSYLKNVDHGCELSEVARLWTNGCIIRSELMNSLVEQLKTSSDLLLITQIKEQVQAWKPALESLIIEAIHAGIAVPSFTAALNYLNGITEKKGPANLIQAQRDFFGAHKYQKENDRTEKYYHTNWES
ncbi:NADP-dependent phosphogluconate dehydrogenase [Robertkochia marina]|nr:NADP-dependent phosphogluconate dehydrogenase [Robertkochia marina]